MNIMDDVLAMVEALQADRKYGPYTLYMRITKDTATTDRRYMRRRARRTGLRFFTIHGRPRIYVLDVNTKEKNDGRTGAPKV